MPRRSLRRGRREVRHLEIGPLDLDALCGAAQPLASLHAGWITLSPQLPAEDEPPPPSPLAAVFGATGHDAPLCSWVPGRLGRGGVKPDALGIQHSTGTRSAARLAERGVAVPDGWKVVQDHPRRGLVVQPPIETPLGAMLGWLLRAGAALSRVDFSGRWKARVHAPVATGIQSPRPR